MTSDTAIIENVVGTTVSVALRNTLTASAASAICSTSRPSLTGLLVGIPLVIAADRLFRAQDPRCFALQPGPHCRCRRYVTEVLSAMKIVQSFGQEQRESERFGVVEAPSRPPSAASCCAP
jgi:ATP-binding cassette, subfamily B, bacterial